MTAPPMVHEHSGTAYKGSRWRTVFIHLGARVIAWDWSREDVYERRQRDFTSPNLIAGLGMLANIHFPPGTDMAVHKAYCRGEMPAAVYADWLEEQGVQMPPKCYDLLRGWTKEASS